MLKTLHIENYALIDELNLEFSDSLNIITGETGAGKSILLGALGLLLGNRADMSAVKDEERNCVVEGVFEIEDYGLEWFFAENDLDFDSSTIIRRVISVGGKSRAYINDLPVQLTVLREFGAHLIDIHSQHQSLMIGEDGFRINILDTVASHAELIREYKESFHLLRQKERELKKIRSEAERDKKEEDWLSFQVEELNVAKLKKGELDELEIQQKELEHAEEITEALLFSTKCLDDQEEGIITELSQISNKLTNISSYYPSAKELAERARSTMLELQDISSELWAGAERVESDPNQLQKTQNRLDTIYTLMQKHKADDMVELLEIKNNYEKRLNAIMDSESEIVALEQTIGKLKKQSSELAAKITKGRKTASLKLTKYVESMLESLGMPGSKFIAAIEPANTLRETGADDIQFLFSANRNINPAPVEKIASGGEISRVMLSIKSLVAKSGKLPTIIFDEIDTGVSGRIADSMGNIINELSSSMQVVNITHLPQVASKGETHFYVYKDTDAPTAQTLIRRLDEEERIEEIAKMLSGSSITEAAIVQARLLLGLSNN